MPLVRAIADWRPHPPFYYGWLVLGTAALGAFAASGVAQLVFGGIQTLILADMGWDRSTIAFAVTAGTWTSGLLTPIVGRLADRHGPRWLMPLAALVTGACFFALAGIRAVWHFYAAYILARAVANPSLIGVVPRTVTVNFFQRRRNLALGLTSMARPVSGAINIQVIFILARAYSWRVAYRSLGAFAIVLAVPLFLVMRRRPEDIGLGPDGDRRPVRSEARGGGVPTPVAPSAGATGEFSWRAGEAALTATFWFIVVAESLVVLTSSGVGFQVVPYLESSGLSFGLAAGALSLSALFGALVNPGWGYLSDRRSPRVLAIIALVITGAVTLLFLVAGSGLRGFFVVVLWGTASGGLNILGSMMIAQYFGRGSFGSIIGLMGPFQTGALGLGPALGAVLVNVTGGYSALFVYALAAYGLAGLFIYGARAPRLPSRASATRRAVGDG